MSEVGLGRPSSWQTAINVESLRGANCCMIPEVEPDDHPILSHVIIMIIKQMTVMAPSANIYCVLNIGLNV